MRLLRTPIYALMTIAAITSTQTAAFSENASDTPPGTTTVVFEQPVQPGTTVTVAVDAKANPGFGGIYEFGVTAYPEGDQVVSQFLGYGRIAFQGTGH
jgi:acyl dehydratase